jgi:hypothetical protein
LPASSQISQELIAGGNMISTAGLSEPHSHKPISHGGAEQEYGYKNAGFQGAADASVAERM